MINKEKNNFNKIIATGRRKSSIATVELVPGSGRFTINNKSGIYYMQENTYLIIQMQSSLDFIKLKNQFDINVNVKGGGLVAQANAIKLGISRALCLFQNNYRKSLKLKGFLTRDARVKERKKYGLKKARKAPQFSKR
jgi:small subunit ribosomal protein S9